MEDLLVKIKASSTGMIKLKVNLKTPFVYIPQHSITSRTLGAMCCACKKGRIWAQSHIAVQCVSLNLLLWLDCSAVLTLLLNCIQSMPERFGSGQNILSTFQPECFSQANLTSDECLNFLCVCFFLTSLLIASSEITIVREPHMTSNFKKSVCSP